nr:hypothetical protein [Tanacetum cinerariifolium]
SLPMQLKNTDWGNEGYGMYKKIEGDGAWHAKFELLPLKEMVYLEWCLEFFSTMYFERGVDRTKLMTEKSVWFRLCGQEHVLTLLEFAVLLGLCKPSELDHRLFAIYFSRLEVGDKLFDHNEYWKKIRKPNKTNKRTLLIQEPLIRIIHRLIVGALVHRLGSKARCEKKELWMMSALEDAHGYYVDKETKKCSKSIECEKWTTKMLAKELDFENQTLLPSMLLPQPPRVTREQRQKLSGLNSSWGDWDVSLNEMERQEMVILHVQC